MKFRYIITDLFDGALKGTNDDQVAKDYSNCEDFFVYDSKEGSWLSFEELIPVESV